VPEAVTFTTTPELARRRLARVGAAGRPAVWVTGDTVSGGSGRSTPYHLPVEQIARHAVAPARHAVAPARHAVAPAQWQRRSAGDGTQGPRRFAWALVRVLPPQPSGVAPTLLIRRPLDAPDAPKELAS